MKFRRHKKLSFREWFKEPATAQDRFASAMYGAWAGIWLGGLGRIIYETPVSLPVVGKFALGGAIICLVVGAVVPKYSRVAFFPFAFFGISSN